MIKNNNKYNIPKYIISEEENAKYFKFLVFEGLSKRYCVYNGDIEKRVEYEIEQILLAGLVDYYLIIWDLIRFTEKQGIFLGSGRGSAPSSIVNYCLGITNVDPIKYNLIFERYFNMQKLSSIDLNVCSDEDINKIVEYLQDRYDNATVKYNNNLHRIVIMPKNYDINIENAALSELDEKRIMSIFINPYIENYNIQKIVELIKKEHFMFDLEKISYDDKEVYKMISNGDTDGLYEFGSDTMKKILTAYNPNSIVDLAACISICRPGPIDNIDNIIENKSNPKSCSETAPILNDILKETYGNIIFQEQIIDIFYKLAGFSKEYADYVRRGMAKCNFNIINEGRIAFLYGDESKKNGKGWGKIAGCIKNNISENEGIKIFEIMQRNCMYAFCKSHAIAYAITAYQLAYLKKYYFDQFNSVIV